MVRAGRIPEAGIISLLLVVHVHVAVVIQILFRMAKHNNILVRNSSRFILNANNACYNIFLRSLCESQSNAEQCGDVCLQVQSHVPRWVKKC